jgi:hypothetical protein
MFCYSRLQGAINLEPAGHLPPQLADQASKEQGGSGANPSDPSTPRPTPQHFPSGSVRRGRARVATVTQPRTVIGIALMDRRRERPRCSVSPLGRSHPQAGPHARQTVIRHTSSRQKRTFTLVAVMYKHTARPTVRLAVAVDCNAANDVRSS